MIHNQSNIDVTYVSMCEHIEKKAVKWLATSLKHFDPQNCIEDDRKFTHKATVELALLVAYRKKLKPDDLDPDYQLILDQVKKIAARPSYFEVIARDHRALLLYGLTHTALSICGIESPAFNWVTTQAVNAKFPIILERIPYRQMDLIHFLYISNIKYEGPTLEDIFPFTILAGNPNVIELEDTDVYAITHAVFYLTDFGLRSALWDTQYTLDFTIEIITSLIRHYRLCNNADLVSELLACLICLGALDSQEISKSIRFLDNAQEPNGLILGPPGIISNSSGKTVDDFHYNKWKTSYHTTIVAALASLMVQQAYFDDSYPITQHCRIQTSPNSLARDSEVLVKKCNQAIENCAKWFSKLSIDSDLSVSLRAIAGLSISIRVLGVRPAVHSALKNFAGRIKNHETEHVSWSSFGSDTLLLVVYGLQSVGKSHNSLTAMVNDLAEGLTADTIIEHPAILPSAVFISRFNALNEKIPMEAVLQMPPISLTRLESETISEFSSRILQLSGGDSKLLDPEGCEDYLLEEILSELMRACKEYRIGDAALLIRMLVLIGERDNRLTKDAVEYILSQQNMDGAFGYFANDSCNQTSLHTHVAWTLGVIWAVSDFAYPEDTITKLFCT